MMASLPHSSNNAGLFSYKSTWQVLGPFQIGTRGTLVTQIPDAEAPSAQTSAPVNLD